jgi:hypothetical protein
MWYLLTPLRPAGDGGLFFHVDAVGREKRVRRPHPFVDADRFRGEGGARTGDKEMTYKFIAEKVRAAAQRVSRPARRLRCDTIREEMGRPRARVAPIYMPIYIRSVLTHCGERV